MIKNISLIPEGIYCYGRDSNGKRVACPYWGKDSSKPEQESGFCTFLDIRDWDEGLGIPLLWDGIKSCNINNGYEEFSPFDNKGIEEDESI